ncbi:MAG: hypothetical protein RIA09_15840 [Hoeflea sp.]|uniref:hypothetical protein n=1 Tax=Hoeflea sp. TaxID=1940281 RepID=UPI0032ED4C5B
MSEELVTEWQPIETAKKDGRLLELWLEPVRYAVDYEVKTGDQLEKLVFGGWPHPKIGYWKQSRWDAVLKKWGDIAAGGLHPLYGWTVFSSAYVPTHWRDIVPPTKTPDRVRGT